METTVTVKQLTKTYKSHKRGQGFFEAVKSLFNRKVVYSQAVKRISFSIKRGELVGFVGQNGAGKSTTIKMLTGVLYPTSGDVNVLGFTPWKQRQTYVRHIGAVFGQKSQLWWDIPPIDSFYLSRAMYDIPEKDFQARLKEMSKLLNINEVMHRPTRDLSLGERMKCEFVMALLHNPQILFLDEPTIGVDALAKEELREFLKRINEKYQTTIVLTTHDMDDIEELCKRVIVIDQGSIIYDDDLKKVKAKYVKWKTIDVDFSSVKSKKKFSSLLEKGEVTVNKQHFVSIRVPVDRVHVPTFVKELMACCDVVDLVVRESRLEHVIKEIYKDTRK